MVQISDGAQGFGIVSFAVWHDRPFVERQKEWREIGSRHPAPHAPSELKDDMDEEGRTDDAAAHKECPAHAHRNLKDGEPVEPTTQNALGMLLVFLASINFSASACIVSAIGLRVPSLQTASCRFWAQLLGASISIVVQKQGNLQKIQTWIGPPEKLLLFFCRGFFGCIALVTLFYGLQHIPLADTYAINYVNIPLTALVAAVVLGDRFGAVDAACMVLCSVGVVMVVQPSFIFGGALSAAIALNCIRLIGPHEDPNVLVMWFALVGTILAPIVMLCFGQVWVPLTGSLVWLEACVGVFGWVGQTLLNRGHQIGRPGVVSVAKYSDILLALVSQTLILKQPSTPLKVCGSIFVFFTVSAFFLHQRRAEFFLEHRDAAPLLAAVANENKVGANENS